MSPYTKILTVSADDLDDLDHVNNVRYVQWIQDISKEHWQSVAPPEMQNGVVWVVMNHNITYKSSALIDDTIRITTYIEQSEGARSIRAVEMRNDVTDQLLLYSRTEWCLLNSKTLKPTRVSEKIKSVFLNQDR